MKKQSILEKQLQATGLSNNEVSAYLALLDLGKGTVSQISRKAGLNRTTGYDILDRLVTKRLVSISGKEPKQEYLAESPDRIENLLLDELEEKQNQLENARKTIPQLKSIHNVAGRPQIRFYEGTEGLRQVYEDTLTSNEPIRAYASVDDVHKALPNYFPQYYKRRTQKNIPIRAIFTDTPEGRELAKHDEEEIRQSTFVSAQQYGFHPEINIYDNKIMIASWREKLGIIIESGEIADAMKKIYELAWIAAKRMEEK
jgi:HTH-type transcriptional regulator, sugar sensing transcriptional regulator